MRLLRDGTEVASAPVTSDDFATTFDVDAGRALLDRGDPRRDPEGDRIEVYSSPVWFETGPAFELGKLKRNKKNGTAKLEVNGLRGPGELRLTGKGLKSKTLAGGPGSATLKLKPKGKTKKKLRKKGKAKVKVAGRLRAAGRRAGAAQREAEAEAQAQAPQARTPMSDLERAVTAVIRDCLGVREGEEVLVVANPGTIGLGERMRAEAGRQGADGILALIAERETHGTEPPASVAAAMAAADVVLCPTLQSLSHTEARRAATEAGVRIATLPGVTEEMLARVMSADVEGLRRKGEAIADRLTAGSEARVTSALGSDLRLGLGEREALPDAGDLTAPGAFGNLPCGEGFIAPIEGTAEGTLVVDGTIAGIGRVSAPVTLTVEGGNLVAAEGAEGERLLELLRPHGEQAMNVAELGIGTNEKAILTGELLEDEKILGTCHVAFGASAAIGGTIQVPVHLDCVVLEPDVSVDGEPLVRGGELLVG